MRKWYTPAGLVIAAWVATVIAVPSATGKDSPADLAARLRAFDTAVFPADSDAAKGLQRMVGADLHTRLREAGLRENEAWRKVTDRAGWEAFRDARIGALRDSLGPFPPVPTDLHVRVTRTIRGDGYRIENLVFESRPGLLVTANLYLPAEASKPPGKHRRAS